MTPLMKQYWGIKRDHLDKILLFRMGDFFEMFHQDAITAAPVLNIALTQRNKKGGDDTKMCGVPHHSIAGPISKLLNAGFKVAICDQVEDPAVAKGIVKRAVTRVLTPGMVYDPETLDQVSANYIAAYDAKAAGGTVAFFDSSTLEAFEFDFYTDDEREQLLRLLKPSELVLTLDQKVAREKSASGDFHFSIFEKDGAPDQRLKSYLTGLSGGELGFEWPAFTRRNFRGGLYLSPKVISHLEIFENYRGESKGSLCESINRTKTSAGARLLKDWLRFPLGELSLIESRQEKIASWMSDVRRLKAARELLGGMGDLERRLGRICSTVCSARDLLSLAEILDVGQKLDGLIFENADSLELRKNLFELKTQIERTFVSEPPLSVKEGGFIERGVYPHLDELIDLSKNAQTLIQDLENREKEALQVSSLKVRYNSVFGFYIEITKTHAHKAPAHYMRKQTLTNAERFTTDELNKIEEKVLSAKTKRAELEYEIFESFRGKILDLSFEISAAAREWAELDVLSALAWLALERKYVRPQFTNEPVLNLELSKHPVLEQELKGFVPNTVKISNGEVILITGPNMAGKSTVMRQVALNVIMAQIGSFVPCESATLPLFRKLFSRVGASDFLVEGLSTFMVEMTEAAEILNSFDGQTLILMDEIGRGTSTYDGLSLAQSIIEHFVSQNKAYTLFSTHYHELTQLEALYPQVINFHMSAHESQGDLKFQHSLVRGPASKSYGIQVAKLAGLPKTVTQRAAQILVELEGKRRKADANQMDLFAEVDLVQAPTAPAEKSPILAELEKIALDKMTPVEVLLKVHEWQRTLS